MGNIFWSEISKFKQQWKVCHNFQAWSSKICHILPKFVQNRHRNRHIAWYNHYQEIEEVKSENRPLRNQTCDLAFHKRDLVLHLGNDSSCLVFLTFSLPWCSGWVVGHMHRHLGIAFLVSGLRQTTACAPYPSKQQRPALEVSCLLSRGKLLTCYVGPI